MDTKTEQFMQEVRRLETFFKVRGMDVSDTLLGNLASENLSHFGYRDEPNEETKNDDRTEEEKDPLFDEAVDLWF